MIRAGLHKKEIVVTYQGDNGTVRIAYRNSAAAIRGLIEQTGQGWVAQVVYERDRKTYSEE